MDFGLTDQALHMIRQVFSANSEINCVKIFGSRALETYRNNSDIDLALWGDVNDQLLAKISNELDELSLPYLFDLQIYNNINHAGLREHIDRYAKVIYLKS